MAITTSARRRAVWVFQESRSARSQGIRSAVYSLRSFAEVETDPEGVRALLQAAKALEEIHNLPSRV